MSTVNWFNSLGVQFCIHRDFILVQGDTLQMLTDNDKLLFKSPSYCTQKTVSANYSITDLDYYEKCSKMNITKIWNVHGSVLFFPKFWRIIISTRQCTANVSKCLENLFLYSFPKLVRVDILSFSAKSVEPGVELNRSLTYWYLLTVCWIIWYLILSCLVSIVLLSCICDSRCYEMDIGTLWHGALVSCISSQNWFWSVHCSGVECHYVFLLVIPS